MPWAFSEHLMYGQFTPFVHRGCMVLKVKVNHGLKFICPTESSIYYMRRVHILDPLMFLLYVNDLLKAS